MYTLYWRRQWQPTPVLLPGKFHGQRSLVGCSAWGCRESDTTEWLHSHFSLSCIGEGNGNPFQCSCLENPRDGEAWWAAVYGVTQSRTRLKRLSSSSSSIPYTNSMKLWAMLCRATQDGRVIVESSDKMWLVHWRTEWQTTLVFLLWEHYEQYEKAKRYDQGR